MDKLLTNSNFWQIANSTAEGDVTGIVVQNANLGSVANLRVSGGSTGQVLTTNGSGNLSFANGTILLDTFALLGITTVGAVNSGTTLVSVSGDQRATITAGKLISFAGQTQVYTVGSTVTFGAGVTDFSISPPAVATIPTATEVTEPTKTPFSEVTAGTNTNLTVANGVMTVSATGSNVSFANSNSITYNTTSNTTSFSVVDGYIANIALGNASYAYRSDITFPSTYLLNNTAGRFMGTPAADRTVSANLVVPADSIDGASANGWQLANVSNATLTGGTYTFSVSDPVAVFDQNGTFNITEAQFGAGNTIAGGELNIRPVANLAAGTYPVRVAYLVNLGPALQAVTAAGGSSNSNISLTGANVSIGNVGNLHILGGSNGQILSTDGTGNLSWVDGITPGLGWSVTVAPSFDTTGGSYVGWSGATQFPVFYANGQVTATTGFTSSTYLGATRFWPTDNAQSLALFADLYAQWHNTVSGALQINTTPVDSFRFTINTAPLATGINPTQTNTQVQNLFNLTNPNAGPEFVNSLQYDDASGLYPFQRAKGGAVVYTENLQQVLQAGNLSNIGFQLTGANGSISAAGNIDFTGANVSLGSVSNLQITGGANGQVLTVANAANGLLSWASGGGIPSQIANGNSNVSIPVANGNVLVSVAGNANIVTVTGTGANITGTANVSGNLSANNITVLSNASNIYTDYLTSYTGNNTPLTISAGGNVGQLHLDAGNIRIGKNNQDAFIATRGSGNLTLQTHEGSTSANIVIRTDGNANIDLNTTGNGVVNFANGASAIGNINAANFVGIFANGNSNISIDGNANIRVSSNGTANVFVVTNNTAILTSNVNATAANTGALLVGNSSNANISTAIGNGNIVTGNNITSGTLTGSQAINASLWRLYSTQTATTNPLTGALVVASNLSDPNTAVAFGGGNAVIGSNLQVGAENIANTPLRASQVRILSTQAATSSNIGPLTVTANTANANNSTSIGAGNIYTQSIFSTANANLQISSANNGNLFLSAGANGTVNFGANATPNLVIIQGNVGNANLDNAFIVTTNTKANLGLIENLRFQSNLTGNSGQGVISNAPPGSAIVYNGNNWEFSPVLNYQNGVALATTTNLAATYTNGTNGVGARLTAVSGGNLVIDGTTNPAVNTRILVKDQTNAATNGIYTVTTTGGVGITWVLTRATDYDTPQEMLGRDVFYVTSGTVNGNASFIQLNAIETVGTTSLVFESAGLATLQTVCGAASQSTQATYISTLNATSSNIGAFVIGGNSSNTQITTAIGNGNIFTGGYIQIGNSADSANTLQIIAKTSNINGTLSGYNMLFAGANSPDTRFVTANSTAAVWTMGYASQAGTLFFPGIQFRSPVTSVAPARILVTPGGGVSNTDLRIESAGTGNIVLLGNTTIGANTGNYPLFAGNGSNTTSGNITFSEGSAGQSLVSAGANRTPHWAFPLPRNYSVVRLSADTTLTGGTPIYPALSLDTNQNYLNLGVSTNSVTGLVSTGRYRITITSRISGSGTALNCWNDFITSNGITSNPAYDSGAVVFQNNPALNDNQTVTATGYLTGATVAYWISFASQTTTLRASGSHVTIERVL